MYKNIISITELFFFYKYFTHWEGLSTVTEINPIYSATMIPVFAQRVYEFTPQ